MQKVIIIGCPGSGKSTFARALSGAASLPLYHLDMLFWNPDKTTVERDVFDSRLKEVMSKPSWIIDGNYARTMERRLSGCDTVFFLDYPTDVCLFGIRERKGKPRPDMPWAGEEDGEDEEFLRFVAGFNLQERPKILELLEKYPSKNIFVFHTRKESEEYILSLKL